MDSTEPTVDELRSVLVEIKKATDRADAFLVQAKANPGVIATQYRVRAATEVEEVKRLTERFAPKP